MKILVIGASSTLAKVLCPLLSPFAEVLTAGRIGFDVPLDLSWGGGEEFRLPRGLDTVIHLAAHFGGKDFSGMLAAEQVNVLGSLKLCHACTLAGAGHLVQVSSMFAGLQQGSPFFGSYALSKRHAEEVSQLYCSSFRLPLTILRPAQIYGVGASFRKHQPFLYQIIDKAESNQEILFYGTRDAERNLMHAEDVAQIIVRVARQRVQGLYSCPSPNNVRYSEIAAAAIRAFRSVSKIRFDPGKPDIEDNAFAPDDRLYELLDFFPRISIPLGMEKEAAHRLGRT
jgi:nucleoside-diphosphate-sugar epimerase